MRRIRLALALIGGWLAGDALLGVASAFAQAGQNATVAAATADPMGALWSLIGSGTVSGVLYFWLRSEQEQRKELSKAMIGSLTADTEHKVVLRERLKSQDEMLVKIHECVRGRP